MRTKDGYEFPDSHGPPPAAQYWLAALVPALLIAVAIFAAAHFSTQVPAADPVPYEAWR